MFEVSLAAAEEVWPLRAEILRPGWTPEATANPEDHEPLSFHVAGRKDGRIVAVASFQAEAHPDLHAGFPFRLRGMATAASVRGEGCGARVLRYGISVLREKRCDLLWAKARVVAFPFYESQGFLYHGPLFGIEGIGPHKVMYKHLIPR